MVSFLLLVLLSVSDAAVLPSGFIVRQFQATRSNVSSLKVEQRVVYSGATFNETLWFKSPSKFKVYVERDGEGVVLIRNGQKCSVIASGARVSVDGICSKAGGKIYYDVLMPLGSFVNYLKQADIKTNYEQTEIQKQGADYVGAEDVILAIHDKTPVYIIGPSNSDYRDSLSSARGAKDLMPALVNNLMYKSPQVWFQTTTNYPVRIYGRDPESGSMLEMLMSSYGTDGNDFPYPASIKIKRDGTELASYWVKNFESNIGSLDDQVFSTSDAASKFPKTVGEAELDDNRKILLDYLKEYR